VTEGDLIYFVNVGDSRAIISRKRGARVVQCTEDHKPYSKTECARILANGGTIYR